MKKTKLLFIAVGLAVLMSGLYISANCSATAYGCSGVSCSVTPPAGGSTQCTSTARTATCIAYDSTGAQCKFIRCQCPTGSPIYVACYAMIPTC